jgi:hypothetical protein
MAIGTPYLIGLNSVEFTTANTTYLLTVTTSTTAGDAIAAFALNTNTAISAISDTKGNVYNASVSTLAPKTYSWYSTYGSGGPGTPTAALVAGTDTISITFGSTGVTATDVAIGAAGCSGITQSTSALDSNGTASAGPTTSTSPAITGTTTLAQASEWIIVGLENATGGGTPSGWGSFTSLGTTQCPGSGNYLTLASLIVSATTAIDASATITSAKWAMLQLALEAATAGGTNASAGLASASAVPALDDSQVSLAMTIQGH